MNMHIWTHIYMYIYIKSHKIITITSKFGPTSQGHFLKASEDIT